MLTYLGNKGATERLLQGRLSKRRERKWRRQLTSRIWSASGVTRNIMPTNALMEGEGWKIKARHLEEPSIEKRGLINQADQNQTFGPQLL